MNVSIEKSPFVSFFLIYFVGNLKQLLLLRESEVPRSPTLDLHRLVTSLHMVTRGFNRLAFTFFIMLCRNIDNM